MSTDYATPDFSGFRAWYKVHRRRSTGRAPSEDTLRTKEVYLRRAARETSSSEERELAILMADPLRAETLLAQTEEGMTPGAARVAVYAFLSFIDYAQAQGWLGPNDACITRQDVPARNPKAPITVYTPDEMEQFITAARGVDVRWWALITFLVDTGRRIGETLDLEWDWFKLAAEPAYVEFPFTKNGEPQYVPLTNRLRDEVFAPANIEWMMSHEKAGRMAFTRDVSVHPFPWNYGTVHGRFERFCERTGLPNRGFHCFRHTVITERLARGVPIQAVSKLAGHSSIATTEQRYDHASALAYAHHIERGS